MITFTSAQLDTWLAMYFYPLVRILALLAVAPVFNSNGMSRRIRLIMGLAICGAIAPALPSTTTIPPGSWQGLAIVGQQLLIGTIMGLTLRIMFAAVDVAGEIIGLQMGLSFASFFDPNSGAQTAVMASFLALINSLLFMAMNGHLLTLSVLAESFHLLPIGTTPYPSAGIPPMLLWSASLFSMGLMLSLPLITALLITNLALGVLARIAPQLNIFAVGFPVTIVTGFVVLLLALPHYGSALSALYERGFTALGELLAVAGASFTPLPVP